MALSIYFLILVAIVFLVSVVVGNFLKLRVFIGKE